MKNVLVDSSVWISYFREASDTRVQKMDHLIVNDEACLNDLILAELLPVLKNQDNDDFIDCLTAVRKIPLNIDWQQIVDWQCGNIKCGINKVGISDLIICQNALQNDLELFSFDKHFYLMKEKHLKQIALFKDS